MIASGGPAGNAGQAGSGAAAGNGTAVRPIVLIGAPGAGKTTVGAALAARLGVGFADTDAIVEAGWKPHLIVGDMDSVSDATLALGAEIVVHAYGGGDAPGAARLQRLGLRYHTVSVPGISEDVAFLLGGLSGTGNLPLLNLGSSPIALTVGANNASTTYSGALLDSSTSTIGAEVEITAGTNGTYLVVAGDAASSFSGAYGSSPTYSIDVSVANTNNYYLRIFVPQ